MFRLITSELEILRRRLRQVRRESFAASTARDHRKLARLSNEAAALTSSIRKVKGLFFR